MLNIQYKGKPIFYGWIIVAGLLFYTMACPGLIIINYGLFIVPIGEELGIGQSIFGWAQAARIFGVAVSSILLGRILDAFGARIPLIVAAIIGGGAIILLSKITAGWHLVFILALLGMLGLQPGGGNLYAVVPISHWFVKNRGKAMSIMFLGWPLGIFFITPLTQWLINQIGWRDTMVVLGIGSCVLLIMVALVVRGKPEDMGLLPDGDDFDGETKSISTEIVKKAISTSEEYSWSRKEALRSPVFWKLGICTGILFFNTSLAGVFRIPYFIALGMDPMMVSYSLSLEALASILFSFIMASFMQRFQIRHIMTIAALGSTLFYIIIIHATDIWQIFIAEAVFGAVVQSQIIADGAIWPSYMGKRHIGQIRGMVVPLAMVFSLSGLPLAGMVFDSFNTYVPVWWGIAVLTALSALIYLFTPKPLTPNVL